MQFGGTGTGDGQFDEINGIDVDEKGRIYVVDAGNGRVQVFADDGSFLHRFGSPGVGEGEFDIGMCGIVVDDRAGRVYVSEGIPDSANHRIQAFGLDGTYEFQFGSQGSGVPPVGTDSAEFESPCQMAMDEDSNLYVVDQGNDRVQVFGPLGTFQFAFGSSGTGDGEFTRPSGIAIDHSGRIYVADSFADRLQIFDFEGNFLAAIGGRGRSAGQFRRPCHLAQGGSLFVADALNERVQVFDLDGDFQVQFPVTGTPQSIFCSNVPTGMATDRLGRIYVEEGDYVTVYSIDRDGDGLLDHWEANGVDTDGDGTVELPLHEPPYNADPDHKDLYLEMDWDEAAPIAHHVVETMKQTLCAAPVDAGGIPNPDGEPGIRLHVDTGSLVDSRASESPSVPCSCADGMDNDGDGLADADDSDCLDLDPAGGEGGQGLSTCADELDNDGDGAIDEREDCPLVHDAFATESAASWLADECGDGMDNDGDGSIDADDPDCLVGDDLGGGNALTDASGSPFSGSVCQFNSGFYDAKDSNFAPERAMVFRYAIQAPLCDLDGDGEDDDARTRAELGGNDTVYMVKARADLPDGALIFPGTYIHELGHNLNLTHGGNDAANCEPNYVSIMNYDMPSSLPKVTLAVRAGTLDFSPARFPGGRGRAPLPPGTGVLDETSLDERTILDSTDRLHEFVYVNGLGEKVRSPLNGDVDQDGVSEGIDWDGDGTVTDVSGLRVNIDTSGADGRPPECTNSSFTDQTGYDDWFNMTLPFRQHGDLADAPLNPVQDPEPTREEIIARKRTLNTTDLGLTLAPGVDPVEVGAVLDYGITITNHGPNPAARVRVVSNLPDDETLVSSHPSCASDGPVAVNCKFGPLTLGRPAKLDVSVTTANACEDGLPRPVGIEASAANITEFPGEDPVPGNNEATLLVDTVDTTAPALACNAPETIAPPDAAVSYTATAEDLCDGDLEPRVTDVQCFRVNPAGRRIDLPCHATTEGATIEIHRTGGVGTIIEWSAFVTDESGNRTEKQCRVEVVEP
jgi:uncharacterized repeat protein (TIGR01451 family)